MARALQRLLEQRFFALASGRAGGLPECRRGSAEHQRALAVPLQSRQHGESLEHVRDTALMVDGAEGVERIGDAVRAAA